MKKFYMVLSHSAPVPPLRTMFSNKAFCCIFLVLVSIVCRQALGGQKYLVNTGKKSPEKHLLVETEDSDEEYGSVEGIFRGGDTTTAGMAIAIPRVLNISKTGDKMGKIW